MVAAIVIIAAVTVSKRRVLGHARRGPPVEHGGQYARDAGGVSPRVRQNDAGPGRAARGPLCVPPPPPAADAGAVEALRADVEAWTVDAVHELLGHVAQAALAREEAVPALRALARPRCDEPLGRP